MEDMDPDKESTKKRDIQPFYSLETPLWEFTLLQQTPGHSVLLKRFFVFVFWIAALEIYYLQVHCFWFFGVKIQEESELLAIFLVFFHWMLLKKKPNTSHTFLKCRMENVPAISWLKFWKKAVPDQVLNQCEWNC